MDISVIIPVYNAAKFVEKAVVSALQFSEVNEVLLIEDCSQDNSLEVCQSLILKDSRVKLFQHPDKKNHGAGASRNIGLKNATQDYIAFLDADDYYLPNRFVRDKEIFKKNKSAEGVFNAIGTHFYTQKAKCQYNKNLITTIRRQNISPKNYFESLILNFGFTSIDGITIKKTALDKVKFFNPDLKQSQDTDFVFRLALNCIMFPAELDKPVAIRGVHENNRIHNHVEAVKYTSQMYLSWIRRIKIYNWNATINYTIFYRYIKSYSMTHNKNKRMFAIIILLKYNFLLLKLNFKDLIYGFYNNFK